MTKADLDNTEIQRGNTRGRKQWMNQQFTLWLTSNWHTLVSNSLTSDLMKMIFLRAASNSVLPADSEGVSMCFPTVREHDRGVKAGLIPLIKNSGNPAAVRSQSDVIRLISVSKQQEASDATDRPRFCRCDITVFSLSSAHVRLLGASLITGSLQDVSRHTNIPTRSAEAPKVVDSWKRSSSSIIWCPAEWLTSCPLTPRSIKLWRLWESSERTSISWSERHSADFLLRRFSGRWPWCYQLFFIKSDVMTPHRAASGSQKSPVITSPEEPTCSSASCRSESATSEDGEQISCDSSLLISYLLIRNCRSTGHCSNTTWSITCQSINYRITFTAAALTTDDDIMT